MPVTLKIILRGKPVDSDDARDILATSIDDVAKSITAGNTSGSTADCYWETEDLEAG